jgi:hypothetical protein
LASQRNRVLDFIAEFPGRDDDEIASTLRIFPRQTVNTICRNLCDEGAIYRERGPQGKLVNFAARKQNKTSTVLTEPKNTLPLIKEHAAASASDRQDASSMDLPGDWFWEGRVVDALERYLINHGWTILSKANTFLKQQGIDIHASRAGKDLLVEVKGYPSTAYRDPKRAGEQKPTNPTNQAQHWYSHALLKALRLQGQHPDATVAIAFPDFARYRTLFGETRTSLEKLGIGFMLWQNGQERDDRGRESHARIRRHDARQ